MTRPAGTRRRVPRLLRDPVRTLVFLLPALLAAGLLPFLVRAGLRTVTNSRQGRLETSTRTFKGPDGKTITTLPPTPAALLVVEDPAGVPATLALMAVAPSGRGGTLVVLPVGMVGASGKRLDAAFVSGGLTELVAEVETTLLITVAARGEAKPDVLGPLLAPLTPVSVTFDDTVRATSGAPGDGILRPAGAATLDGPSVAAVLAAHGPDESELARLPRNTKVWSALLATPHDGGTLTPPKVGASGPLITSVLDALGALAASATTVVAVAVEPKAATGPGEELVADTTVLRSLVARVLPGAVSALDGHPRLRIVNPSGDPALSSAVAGALLVAGANIVMIDDHAGTVPTASFLLVADAARVADIEPYRTALAGLDIRPGAVQTGGPTVDGVDATVTLGLDAARAASNTTAPTSATSIPNADTPAADTPATT